MVRYNRPTTTPRTSGPIRTTSNEPTLRTFEGAAGYKRDVLSELFLLACSNFVSQDTFYESGKLRDARYLELIQEATKVDFDWVCRFVPWLRNNANMRTAAIILAVEAVRAKLAITKKNMTRDQRNRELISSVLVRADEPGEMLAYYMAHYGRNVPRPIKRGIADAAGRLYTQRNVLKYDTASKGWSFGGVIEFTGAVPQMPGGVGLFKYLVTKSRGRKELVLPDYLTMLHANATLRRDAARHPELLLNTARLRQAGMTWEDVLSLAGSKVNKRDLWRAIIPEMGYMALLRNLRNFDEVGVAGDEYELIKQKLMDPDEVARSRQLPMRFLSAYRAVPSNRWAHALDVALQLSLQSIPELPGSTLILIDTSGSMNSNFGKDTSLKLWDAAAIFGLALAERCELAQVVAFSNRTMPFPSVRGESLLKGLDRFRNGGYFMGQGTDTRGAVAQYAGQRNRIIILTDEQAMYGPNHDLFPTVSAKQQIVTFNLAGYEAAQTWSSPNRVTVGGLSDAAFTLLGALDRRSDGQWPF